MPVRRKPTREMPAEHALLGLLRQFDGSRHGYDLQRAFQQSSELGEVIRLEPGMLYHHLKKLERLGWVISHQEQVDRRPARSVYTLTPEGQAELNQWMGEPVEHTREIRLTFLVKLYLARLIDPKRAAELIAEQIATLERLEQAQQEGPAAHDFSSDVRALRSAQTRAALDWLRTLDPNS